MSPSRVTKRRALGQHFLRDRRVAQAVVDLARLGKDDLCVEIGPGEGALTWLLAERAGRLVALEMDESLLAGLARQLARRDHVELRLADARRFDFTTVPALRPAQQGRVVVVGNLPYSVAKPILAQLLEARGAISEMVLMLQREVAERVAAPPGSKRYGALSLLCQLHCDIHLAFIVPPGAFRPPPRVDSAVVKLAALPASRLPLADEAVFRRVVKAAFSHRRKSLANALAGGLHLSVETSRGWLTAAGINPMRRAESLSLEEFARLTTSPPADKG
ncbi:MAG: 16S rRNA (adenine(1518)-N(6)/adenine(1519)-N(6))-dimethyltransferase RsmA [Candidatus Methylomirabilia bacterium]